MYRPQLAPYGHQVTALQRIASRPSSPSDQDVFALLMEYGTGKSKVVCDEFGAREEAGDLQDIAVVAGAGSYRNWDRDKSAAQPSEFHRHLSGDLGSRLRTAAWVSGQGVVAKRALDTFIRDVDPRRPRALVMNIEALSTVQAARDLMRAFLSAPGRRAMLVDDESTNIKDGSSERAKQMLKLAPLAAARRILTGLVVPNSPMDLFSQFEFLDWRVLGQRSFFSYRSRYAVLKRVSFLPTEVLMARGAGIPGIQGMGRDDLVKALEARHLLKRSEVATVEVAYRNEGELSDLIAPYSYRVLKGDCLDLPPKVYMPIREVPLTDEQRRIYRDMKETASAELASGKFATAQLAITRTLRMRQLICGYQVDEDGNEEDVPERRSRDLLEVLGEHHGKAIIWVPFKRTLLKLEQLVLKEFGPGTVAKYYGGNVGTRLEDEARFLSDPSCRFMLSTQAAGGRGNTWNVASLVCYFGNDYDLELRLNSEDRAHRAGQDKSVAYVDWVAPGTSEEKIIPALRAKIDIASVIMRDGPKAWLA